MVLSNPATNPLAARTAGLLMPEGGVWASEARKAALQRLTAMGLPGRRDEYWRFTRPDSLNAPEPEAAGLFDHGGEAPVYGEIDRVKLVFVDGVFSAEESDPLENQQLPRAEREHTQSYFDKLREGE